MGLQPKLIRYPPNQSLTVSVKNFNIVLNVFPNLCICVTIDAMLKFDGDVDVDEKSSVNKALICIHEVRSTVTRLTLRSVYIKCL